MTFVLSTKNYSLMTAVSFLKEGKSSFRIYAWLQKKTIKSKVMFLEDLVFM